MFLFADARTTFYVTGIIFMIFLMVVAFSLLIIALTIVSKIRSTQKKIKSQLDAMTSFAGKGKAFVDGFRRVLSSRY